MKVKKIALAVAVLLGTPVAWAAPVGKVLAVAGDAFVTRAGQESRLQFGAPVENGDSLRVGDASTLQVRFIDESIVSLRANSVFKIEDFKFDRNPASDKSIFGLIRGGLRTVTGLIGKQNQNSYAVKGPTATIGIRGTHFTVVACSAEALCRNPDGGMIDDGLYGAVTDGRIAVINDLGEFQFGQQEYFRLMARNVAPERLLAPPAFLSAGFETAARGRSRTTAPASVASAQESSGSAAPQTSTSPQLASMAPITDALPANAQKYVPADTPAISGGASSPIVAGDGKSPTATTGLTGLIATASPTDGSLHAVETLPPDTTVTWSASGWQSATTSSGYMNRGMATTAERGADAGVIEWGRWVGGPTQAGGWGDNLTFSSTQGMHYIVGSPTTDLPTAGTGVAYALLGATAPTFSDGSGNGLGLGSVTGGSAKVNFVGRTVNAGFDLAFAGGNTYKLSLAGSFSGANITGSGSMAQTAGSNNVCPGSDCSATFSGFFAGSGASHLGLGYDVATRTTTPLYLNGVAALTRSAVPPEPTLTGSWTSSFNEAAAGLKSGNIVTGYADGQYSSKLDFNNFQVPSGLSATTTNPELDFNRQAVSNYTDNDLPNVTLSKDASTNTGSFSTADGIIYWGRFKEIRTSSTAPAEAGTLYTHWAVGPAMATLPTSGTFAFSHVGGTTPTDQTGATGTLTSGGSWIVNFVGKTLQSGAPVTWTMPGSVAYTVNVASPVTWTTGSQTSTQTSANGGTLVETTTGVNTLAGNWGSCSGSGCTLNGTWISPQFTGASASGLTVGIRTSATVGGNEQATAQVQVYGNPAPYVPAPPPGPTSWQFSETTTSSGTIISGGMPYAESSTSGATDSTLTLSAGTVLPAGDPGSPLAWNQQAYSGTQTETSGTSTTTTNFSKTASTDSGSFTGSEGTWQWGRFKRDYTTTHTSGGVTDTYTGTDYTHWSYGPAATSLPTSGTFTFTHVGGTTPTDQAGVAGTLSSGGSWAVNFAGKTLQSASPVQWTMANGVAYNLHVTTPLTWATTGPTTSSQPIGTGTATTVSTSVNSIFSATTASTCSPNCTLTYVQLSPQFGGANATGLSMGITTRAAIGAASPVDQTTAQVQIYKR